MDNQQLIIAINIYWYVSHARSSPWKVSVDPLIHTGL